MKSNVENAMTPNILNKKNCAEAIVNEKNSECLFRMGMSEIISTLIPLMSQYGKSNAPVMILGEVGTGKRQAAIIMRSCGRFSRKPFCCLDFAAMTDRKWQCLLSSEDSPFLDSEVSIYIKNFEFLEFTKLLEFEDYCFQSELLKRNRFYFSYQCNFGETEIPPQFKRFMDKFSCLMLRLPALRERKEDIPEMASFILQQVNSSLGKGLLGFSEVAMSMLMDYIWPGNIEQLQRVLQSIALFEKGRLITPFVVRTILHKESPVISSQHLEGYYLVNLNQTLAKIETDIVRILLTHKNMTQKRLASKLGISRTTLWRILKRD